MADRKDVKVAVRDRYSTAARSVIEGGQGCCGPAPSSAEFGCAGYDTTDTQLPQGAKAASLGCGNPTAVAELHPGETVLDLGSGGGIDVLLSAQRVGATGYVYGLDMTPEMIELARRNAAEASATNVEFLQGDIENIPLPDGSVDVIISNCVINLSIDKPAVFAEAHRVLRPGGRFAVSDIVTRRPFTDAERADMAAWTGCVSGALVRDEYIAGLKDAGFRDVEVVETAEYGPDIVSAIIRASA